MNPTIPTILLAGQQLSKENGNSRQSKRPALSLNIPASPQEAFDLLDASLGSPFRVYSPSTPIPKTATANTPLTSVFFDWDKEVVETGSTDAPLEEEDEEDSDVQIITISFGKPFHSPARKTSFTTPTFTHPVTFACAAFATGRSPARVLHEELERLIQLNDNHMVFDLSDCCSEETEIELLDSSSPVVDAVVLSDFCMDLMDDKTTSPYPPVAVWRKALPDVPYDLEPLDADLEDLEDLEQDLGDDEDYSSDEAVTPLVQSAFGLDAHLNTMRLVAPFEFDYHLSTGVLPSKLLF